jgi:hypothetical protein
MNKKKYASFPFIGENKTVKNVATTDATTSSPIGAFWRGLAFQGLIGLTSLNDVIVVMLSDLSLLSE